MIEKGFCEFPEVKPCGSTSLVIMTNNNIILETIPNPATIPAHCGGQYREPGPGGLGSNQRWIN